ncbi:MAG TPA: pyridoxamine 5'-phosphate oxidase family protein [Pyrinomonadaceae bacterium]
MAEQQQRQQQQQQPLENRDEEIKKIAEFIRDIDFTMMTTIDEDGELQSRPMSTQKTEFDGSIYFFTFDDTDKIRHIRKNPRVNLAYSAPDQQTYVSLRGRAEESKDRQKMEELWSPELKAWFPEGLETPGIALLKVKVESAEYWDSTSSMIAHAVGFAKAIITGESYEMGENKTVELDK